MIPLLLLPFTILASPFKSNGQLAAENMALRHQVMVLRQARECAHAARHLTCSHRSIRRPWAFLRMVALPNGGLIVTASALSVALCSRFPELALRDMLHRSGISVANGA